MQSGVAIDLSKLNSIKVDKKAATLTVGPGVHFGEVFDPLYKAGLQIRESQIPNRPYEIYIDISEQRPELQPALV